MGLLSKIKKDLITAPLGQPKPSIGLQRLFKGVTPKLPQPTRRSGFFPGIKRAIDDVIPPVITPPRIEPPMRRPEPPMSIGGPGGGVTDMRARLPREEPIINKYDNRMGMPEPILQPLPQLIPSPRRPEAVREIQERMDALGVSPIAPPPTLPSTPAEPQSPEPVIPEMPDFGLPDLSSLQNISPLVTDAMQQSLASGDPVLAPDRIEQLIQEKTPQPIAPIERKPLIEAPRIPIPPKPPSIGGVGGINVSERPLEPVPAPPLPVQEPIPDRPAIPIDPVRELTQPVGGGVLDSVATTGQEVFDKDYFDKRDDFMSIGGPGGGAPDPRFSEDVAFLPTPVIAPGGPGMSMDEMRGVGLNTGLKTTLGNQQTTISGQPLVPGIYTAPATPQTGLTAAELLELSDEELQRYIPRETLSQGVGSTRRTYDATPSPEEFRQTLQREINLKPGDRGYDMRLGGPRRYNPYDLDTSGNQTTGGIFSTNPNLTPGGGTTVLPSEPVSGLPVEPVQTAPSEPAAVATTGGAVPTQSSMPMGSIDPVLMGQTAQETITDPLIRALYFGTQDSPGFYQQLQQAGANLIGSDVPLQETAGLTPLELLARQQAVAGLGGFEPFLQQNRELVEQAIEQSRRAEELQDPYYTQAEEIYKDTMGAYDPSMTQQFYNPFEQAVVDKTIQDVMEAGEKQDIASRAREISAGAFGGSRARLGAEERREALGEGLAQALGSIRQQGFSEAQRTGLSEFARQQAAKRTGAQGLMGIGVGRGSAASALGSQLAGYGSQIGGIGSTQEGLRAGQRGELAGFGGVGRGIAETGLSRIFQQQLGQQQRPLSVLGQIGAMLPGYQQTSTQIGSQYGLPTDPSAAGLGAAFSAYGALAPRQG
jgi:hypothetical protein